MTFEARDNAAKVVPARHRLAQGSTIRQSTKTRGGRKTASQKQKWDQQVGLFLVNRSPSPNFPADRPLTAELLKFSKTLDESKKISPALKRSPSAPILAEKKSPLKKRTEKPEGCSLLNPTMLKRHAMSVDNPSYNPQQVIFFLLKTSKPSGP